MMLWRPRRCTLIVMLGSLVLSPVLSAASRNHNAEIPALLQFAEEYNEQTRSSATTTPPPPAKHGVKKASANKSPQPRNENRRIKDKEIQRQSAEIIALKSQITDLKQTASTVATMPDLSTLSKLARGLRQSLAITPTEHQTKAHILKMQNIFYRDRAALQQQLSKANRDNQALSAANDSQKNLLIEAKKRTLALQEQQEEMKTQRRLMQAELDDGVKELANLRAESASLQARSPLQVTSEVLKAIQPREDYAAGVSLGEEILQMQEERQRWGVASDKQMILAGIADTFAGKRMLTNDELNKVLATAEKKVADAREKVSADQQRQGAAYAIEFKKDKRVRQAASGFWYRVDYTGDVVIPDTASVDVIVKETLVDGTVIQDMEASGATLSQPVAKFPPLFKEAISLLKNHGSMTLLVPPEKAYGEKGYPPKVPPNASMIYTIRIAEMYPESPAKNQ